MYTRIATHAAAHSGIPPTIDGAKKTHTPCAAWVRETYTPRAAWVRTATRCNTHNYLAFISLSLPPSLSLSLSLSFTDLHTHTHTHART